MPPRFASTRALLTAVLEHEPFGADDLDEVTRGFDQEDQHLDYKAGQITGKTDKQLRSEILRFVTGFANAEGGLLILGASEDRPRRVTGAVAPGRSPLIEWATRILAASLGYFSPPPRIFTVTHNEVEVLLIAVTRAPQLAPYVEEGEMKYALRLGDSTITVPPFLISDLVLGRRNQPVLHLREVRIFYPDIHPSKPVRLSARLFIENLSLFPSENTTVGTASWSLLNNFAPFDPSSHLLQNVDMAEPPATTSRFQAPTAPEWTWNIRHANGESNPLIVRPFDLAEEVVDIVALLPTFPREGHLVFALYLLPRLAIPTWYEVACEYWIVDDDRFPLRLQTRTTIEKSTRPRLRWLNR